MCEIYKYISGSYLVVRYPHAYIPPSSPEKFIKSNYHVSFISENQSDWYQLYIEWMYRKQALKHITEEFSNALAADLKVYHLARQ